jgi:hypothetical protein
MAVALNIPWQCTAVPGAVHTTTGGALALLLALGLGLVGTALGGC